VTLSAVVNNGLAKAVVPFVPTLLYVDEISMYCGSRSFIIIVLNRLESVQGEYK
jgi:hypothetical protein